MFLNEFLTKTMLNSRLIAAAVVAAALTACGGGSGAPVEAQSASNLTGETIVVRSLTGETRTVALSADAYTPAQATSPFLKAAEAANSAKAIVALRPVATVIELAAPSQAKVSIIEQKQENRPVGVPLQVGFARPVAETTDPVSTSKLLTWSATASGGKVTALELKSLSAKGLRVGILVKSLPNSALLRFYTPEAIKVTEVTGQKINQTIQTNIEAGDTSSSARTYWGPQLKGERSILEIELPAGVDFTQLEISIPNISHVFTEPFVKTLTSIGDQAKGIGAAGSCEVDVSCAAALPPVSNAIAYMSFMDNNNSYECTGTLLNDTASSGIPYFLTANHCISNQTVASTLFTGWFAKSSACNNNTLNPNAVFMDTGAILLWTRSAASGANGRGPAGTDTTFLRLNSQPPAGAMYAGWSAAAQSVSTNQFAALHHPRGDLQKISRGVINSYTYSSALNAQGGFTTTTNGSQTQWPLYSVSWTSGVTEGGSSGGGLFTAHTTTNPKLVGQLLGGGSSCSAPTSSDYYGRFDIAYQEGLNTWLSPNMSPVYRFYNSASNSYFMTNSVIEKNIIQTYYSQFIYEGFSFFASPETTTDLSPVYRFRNLLNGSYLWTISDIERAVIAQNYSATFVQENIAWYSRTTASAGWVPLYRFRDITNGTYLFTASEIERQSILQNYSARFVYEGIAYYVRNNP
jgi:lysyl endopeptidase